MILFLTPWKADDNSPMRRCMNKYDVIINVEYNEWRSFIDDVDLVVVIASKLALEIVSEIRKTTQNKRVIMYWWDPVEHTISPNEVSVDLCERVSFNLRDAKRYGIKYNPQFAVIDACICNEIEYDISFVGRANKVLYNTRLEMLNVMSEYCNKNGLRTYFALLYDDGIYMNREYEIQEYIPENLYYETEQKSRAILDITAPSYNWMTLRPLEALFFHKKLITNNIDIKEEKLYHPNNVFVLGIDDIEELSVFLDKPMYEFDYDVFEEYSCEKWLERFE